MDCAICLEVVGAEQVCRLSCGHVFHSSCVLQSAMHDPRCPVCRAELAKKPDAANVVNVELTIGDVHNAVEEEYQSLRRQQVNYDARRRRFLRRRPELQQEHAAMKVQEQELRELERRIAAKWYKESQALWMGETFVHMKKQRALLLRRIRRREKLVGRGRRGAGRAPEHRRGRGGEPRCKRLRAWETSGRGSARRRGRSRKSRIFFPSEADMDVVPRHVLAELPAGVRVVHTRLRQVPCEQPGAMEARTGHRVAGDLGHKHTDRLVPRQRSCAQNQILLGVAVANVGRHVLQPRAGVHKRNVHRYAASVDPEPALPQKLVVRDAPARMLPAPAGHFSLPS